MCDLASHHAFAGIPELSFPTATASGFPLTSTWALSIQGVYPWLELNGSDWFMTVANADKPITIRILSRKQRTNRIGKRLSRFLFIGHGNGLCMSVLTLCSLPGTATAMTTSNCTPRAVPHTKLRCCTPESIPTRHALARAWALKPF